MNRKTAAFLLVVACLLALAGCSAIEFNRNLEDAIGSAARTKVQTLGTPDKRCDLVRLDITKAYAVVLPRRILRLGEEYPQVSVARQFSGNGIDYAVLQCVRANGSVENYLLQIFSSSRIELYRLDSSSRQPFAAAPADGVMALMQDTDTPGQVRYWTVAPSSVRGPSLISGTKLRSGKSAARSGKKKTAPRKVELPMADLPVIQQDTSVRLEADTPPDSAAAPAATAPVIVVDSPKTGAGASQSPASQPPASGATSGAASGTASGAGAAKPYTIVVE